MISYRKLAMRVLGHPLRVPTNTPRPASHRMTVLALTAAMVAGLAAPAYADTYYIDKGDITVTKDTDGIYVKHSGNNDATKDSNNNVIIQGGSNPTNTPSGSESGTTGTTSATSPAQSKLTSLTSEYGESKAIVYRGGTSSTGVTKTGGTPTTRSWTLAKSMERSSPVLTYTNANDGNASQNESTTALETATKNFTDHIIQIINNVKDSTLNVTLDKVNIDASKGNDAALSVEGKGNTTITLEGSNTLTSGFLHAGLEHNEKSEDGSKTGKLTITSETDGEGNNTGSLKATAGAGCAAGIGSVWNT